MVFGTGNKARHLNLMTFARIQHLLAPTRESAQELKFMAPRIGDLVVIGDKDTVFGELDDEKEVWHAAI